MFVWACGWKPLKQCNISIRFTTHTHTHHICIAATYHSILVWCVSSSSSAPAPPPWLPRRPNLFTIFFLSFWAIYRTDTKCHRSRDHNCMLLFIAYYLFDVYIHSVCSVCKVNVASKKQKQKKKQNKLMM